MSATETAANSPVPAYIDGYNALETECPRCRGDITAHAFLTPHGYRIAVISEHSCGCRMTAKQDQRLRDAADAALDAWEAKYR